MKKKKNKILWERNGYIVSIGKDYFICRLFGKDNLGEEEAKICIDRIEKENRNYIIEGINFTWTIERVNGKTKGKFVFNNSMWNKKEIEGGKKGAERIGKELNWKK